MRICGVISEFNPFHNGHKYLLSKIRENGFDAVVCVMSGNFVQRGEYAAFDKRLRANSAVTGGADLVLSLPFPWSSASAEIFACAGIGILEKLGCVEAVAFGSECADIPKIQKCAAFLSEISPEDVKSVQKNNPKMSYAQAREKIVGEKLGNEYSELLSMPNDILAVEYVRAIKRLGSSIVPVPVKRVGAAHNDKNSSGNISSSSVIRSMSADSDFSGACEFIPERDIDYLKNNFRKVDKEAFFRILSGAVLSKEPSELCAISEIGGGFEYALYRELLASKTYDELFKALRSRHITDAKIRRAMLFTALGVKKEAFRYYPGYCEVLAFSEGGRKILSNIRKSCDITILSKAGNIKNASEQIREQFALERKAEIILEKIAYKL